MPRQQDSGSNSALMTRPDPARLEVVAEHYRSEAETCLEMAEQATGVLRDELILAAARWLELAQEAEAGRRPN
jgi:hypothetical protein